MIWRDIWFFVRVELGSYQSFFFKWIMLEEDDGGIFKIYGCFFFEIQVEKRNFILGDGFDKLDYFRSWGMLISIKLFFDFWYILS